MMLLVDMNLSPRLVEIFRGAGYEAVHWSTVGDARAMAILTVQAVIEKGQIRLPTDLHLPDQTKVYVVVPDVETEQTVSSIPSPRLAHPEQAEDFKKEVIQGTSDAGL